MMNLNPFNFQQAPNWGADGQKKLNNMVKSEQFEASNGQHETKVYQQQKPKDAQHIIDTSSPQQIKHWLEMQENDRQGIPGITI